MRAKKILNMLLVASVSVLAFLMCACGNEEPAANAGEETSRTDQPTVEKEDGAEEKDLDGAETFPETDHLFKDDDVFTEFGVSGGKKTIVYNFRSQPYFSFATSEDLLTKDADGKIKVAKTDIENNPSYCVFSPTDIGFFHPGDVVNSNNYLYNDDFLKAIKEVGVSVISFDEADKSLNVTAGKDEWFNAEINYAGHTITFEVKPNATGEERVITFVMFGTYNLAFPTEYVSNAVRIKQNAR